MRFYPKAKPASAYRKLHALASRDYIRPQSSYTGVGFVWTLGEKGFAIVRSCFDEMKQTGYKSEAVGHDLLCMAAMLGEWIHGEPNGVEFFSEQELRRFDPAEYPMWVPQSDVHRSDGFWKLPKLPPDTSVAIEVERSQKSLKKYDLVADFYEEYPLVQSVIWITPIPKSQSPIANQIQRHLDRPITKHNFISLDDFAKLGWQAKFRIGKLTGHTLAKYLVTLSSPSHHQGDSRLLLETRKKPLILDPNQISTSHGFFN